MISYNLILLCSYSVIIAVIIGLIRFRNINRAYYPFLLIMAAALINESVSTYLIKHFNTNAVSVNILNLTETLLWLWQFRKWETLNKSKAWEYPMVAGAMVIVWSVENLALGRLFIFSSIFSLVSSCTLVFLCINQVNKLIMEEKKNLLRNSTFLICSGAMIFHTYKIMVESFYVMKLDESNEFLSNIFIILVFVNLFVNLLYALATLWIPTRQRFTMQY